MCKPKDKLLSSKFKRLGYEVRNISKNPEWRKEAKSYNLGLPFIVENGLAKKL